jgi:hypothetical protein
VAMIALQAIHVDDRFVGDPTTAGLGAGSLPPHSASSSERG